MKNEQIFAWYFFFLTVMQLFLTLWKAIFSIVKKKGGELNLEKYFHKWQKSPELSPEPRLKLAEGGKRKSTNYIQGLPIKVSGWFSCRKFAGQKEVALYIQYTEKKKICNLGHPGSKVFIQNGRRVKDFLRQIMAKKRKEKRKSKIVSQY